MKALLLATTALVFAATLGTAQAAPITGTFGLTIWHTSTAGGLINSPANQALPTSPLNAAAFLVGTGTYTGAINFTGGGSGTIGQFLASASGTTTIGGLNSIADSAPGFNVTTLYKFTGTTGAISGTIGHDDGASLFQGGVNALPTAASAPTVFDTNPYSLAAGTFDLWYVEANGLPANLIMDVTNVPEPMSLALLGGGLLGLGLIRRRQQ